MNKPNLALVSIAASGCILALLAMQDRAYASSSTCAVGLACTLGYMPGVAYHPMIGWTQIPDSNYGIWNYGTCGFDTSSPPVCACQGWMEQPYFVATGDPYMPTLEFGGFLNLGWAVNQLDPQCYFPED